MLFPVIGLALTGADLSSLEVPVGDQIFGVGNFLVAMITFIIVAFVIFVLVKITKRWEIA